LALCASTSIGGRFKALSELYSTSGAGSLLFATQSTAHLYVAGDDSNGPELLPGGAKCEDIEPVDVIWSRNRGAPKWRVIVFAWENLAKIYAGEFLFGSETVAWVENPACGSELIVMRNETLKQVRPIPCVINNYSPFPSA
jgi:hypothetical protein